MRNYMSKTHFLKAALFGVVLVMFASTGRTQTPNIGVVGFNQGNWQIAQESINGQAGCACGEAAYDCICGLAAFHIVPSRRPIPVVTGQIYAVAPTYIISGTTLQIILQEALGMKLKSNDFNQNKALPLDGVTARLLGYESVTIQPGKYTIRGGKSITLNVKLGKKTKSTDTLKK